MAVISYTGIWVAVRHQEWIERLRRECERRLFWRRDAIHTGERGRERVAMEVTGGTELVR